MALIVKDRVRETTTTTGTGTITLIAPVSGFQSFSVIGNGNTTYYCIVDVATGSWEVGIGTYTSSGTTLSRDTVLESSTGGAKISFSSGTKDVFCTYPAERSVSQADVGTDPNEIPLNQYLGSMAYQDRTAVNIGGGVATLSTATITSIQNDTEISNVEPSLMLNFAAVEALDPRITYSRASTATYYNGVTTAVAEQNLALYSQEFDQATWSKGAVTVTANSTAAPDGTTTADTVIPTATTATHQISSSTSIAGIGVYTLSVYAKATGYSYVQLMWGSGTDYANFFLSGAGSVSQNSGGSPTITSVGNDWYRCSITTTLTVASAIYFLPMQTGTETRFAATTGDGTSGLFLWGAQLEQRSAVTAYTVTTTQPITNYIPVLLTAASGVPRFDHNPISQESLGFLIEQQSTNLVLQSQTFDSATWIKTDGGAAVTVIPNTIIAPDGTLTGDKLDEAGGFTQSQVIRQSVTVANSTAHTFSFYAKAAERSFVYTQAQGANNFQVVFNLTAGTVGVSSGTFTSATITPVGNNWYRCAVTATSTTTSVSWYIEPQATNALGTHLGVANNGIFLWGAQVEATAFTTSYIATVASQVTRAADVATMTGTNFSSWYSPGEGSFFASSTTSATGIRGVLGVGEFANDYYLAYSGSDAIYVITTNGVAQTNLTRSKTDKLAIAYKTNDACFVSGGGAVDTDTTVTLPTVTSLRIGNFWGVPQYYLNGTIKKISYFPRRLSNAELQEMTS